MKQIAIFVLLPLLSIASARLLLVAEDEKSNKNTAMCQGRQDFLTTDSPFRCEEASENKTKHMEDHLEMDQALLTVVVQKARADLTLYANWDVCWKCPCFNLTVIPVKKNVSCVLYSAFPISMEIYDNTSEKVVASIHKELDEYGYYKWIIEEPEHGNTSWNFYPMESSSSVNTPIYVAIGVLVGLAMLYALVKKIYRKGYLYRFAVCMPHERLINTDLGAPEDQPDGTVSVNGKPPVPLQKQRLQSLDTFRGLSLVIMIFVNYSGGGYWFFHHSAWNGLTVADLVFPWFTFIMGTSIALAFRKLVTRGVGKKQLILKVCKRTVILFVIGLMISNDGSHGFVDVSKLRIPGVLQRLAVTYCAVAVTEVFFAGRSLPTEPEQARWWCVRDLLPFWPEWIISLSFLTIHLCLTFLLKVPGCPTGYLGPGGIQEYAKYVNCTGGASGYIDRQVFGESHLFHHPTCTVPYQTTIPYDPEGLLGTLTSIFMCFLGLQAGKILVIYPGHVARVKRWLIWGVLCGVIAGVLCKFSQNDGWIPVNKNFWSVSFILALSSMAFVLLSVCYLVIDVWGLWSGAPFLYPGMNSIVVYVCHEVFHQYFPVQFAVANTHAARLALHLYGTAIWTIMAAILYYKKIFIAI